MLKVGILLHRCSLVLKLDGLEFPCLDSTKANWLERLFQEHKVLQAMLSMDGDKVLGSNGFSIAFFRSCWAIVKDDLLLEFYNFHEHGIFEKSLNATFVALIPKKPDN